MTRVPRAILFIAIAAGLVVGCSGKITIFSVDKFDNDLPGVPWVEPKLYHVYVFKKAKIDEKTNQEGEPTLLYYSQHLLTDKVNGTIIDPDRRKWAANYQAQTFSSATLTLEFYENGNLKKAGLTSKSGAEGALKALGAGLETSTKVEEAELAELEREYKRLKFRNDIKTEKEKAESTK